MTQMDIIMDPWLRYMKCTYRGSAAMLKGLPYVAGES